MDHISGWEILFVLLNIALGSAAIMAAVGIILITKTQLARSWFLIGIAVGFFVIKEICYLLTVIGIFNLGAIRGIAEFLFVLILALSVFYQYKIIRDISKKVK
ncbi:MAG: hypothetical protein HYS07_03285 [Chlamydiae bacterium]|nr:hypothetical protein [Chlamydiota bacterium]MBI3276865.1 hypothetical protein [Chlamydiota bacterium]